jgi:hypothetical protein
MQWVCTCYKLLETLILLVPSWQSQATTACQSFYLVVETALLNNRSLTFGWRKVDVHNPDLATIPCPRSHLRGYHRTVVICIVPPRTKRRERTAWLHSPRRLFTWMPRPINKSLPRHSHSQEEKNRKWTGRAHSWRPAVLTLSVLSSCFGCLWQFKNIHNMWHFPR